MEYIRLPAQLMGAATKVDGGLSLRFVTNEISHEEKVTCMEALKNFGWLVFAHEKTKEVPLPDHAPEDRTKTPSARLRSVLFALYCQTTDGSKAGFDGWYRERMERLIDQIKSRLDH